jgi:hypothetical protein
VADLFFSADIEADGPIPGEYSMLAIGVAIAGRFDGTNYSRADPAKSTFYRELQPISDHWDGAALEVASLDRERLLTKGADPARTMRDLAHWVANEARQDRPVLVGFPVVFDWMFIHWYFIRFTGASPFGHSSALDMKTMYQQKARALLDDAGLDDLPRELRSWRRHTHNALDDAMEQADIFSNLF